MILYNITTIVETAVSKEWLKWMNETHIPAVMATQKFISHKILQVLDSPNEDETYCVQYLAKNMDDYLAYQQNHDSALQTTAESMFKDKFVSFKTLMKYVN